MGFVGIMGVVGWGVYWIGVGWVGWGLVWVDLVGFGGILRVV